MKDRREQQREAIRKAFNNRPPYTKEELQSAITPESRRRFVMESMVAKVLRAVSKFITYPKS
jgi:hypothetical protein